MNCDYLSDFDVKERFLLSRLLAAERKGIHSLNKVDPDSWAVLVFPTKFGRKFYKWARRGAFKGVNPVGRGPNNHQQYMFA